MVLEVVQLKHLIMFLKSLGVKYFFLPLITNENKHNPDELNVSKVGSPKSKTQTATIGLVVHAAADGIALGAAASTDRNDLQFIVFLAIMLHKVSLVCLFIVVYIYSLAFNLDVI